jgi:GNAT superfamily N-acetyltransferase
VTAVPQAVAAGRADASVLGPLGLGDGTVVEVRTIDASDVCRLRRLFDRLSPTSVYFRFFAPIRRPRAGVLEHLAAVDHERREAIVALADDEIIAVARYDAGTDGDEAELAVTVEDAWQGRGLGKLLSRRLARLARQRGFTAFTATVLGENRAALALMHAITPDVDVRFRSGQYDVYVPLRGTAARSRVR